MTTATVTKRYTPAELLTIPDGERYERSRIRSG